MNGSSLTLEQCCFQPTAPKGGNIGSRHPLFCVSWHTGWFPTPSQPPNVLVALKGRSFLYPQGLLRPSLNNASSISASLLASDWCDLMILCSPKSVSSHVGQGPTLPVQMGLLFSLSPGLLTYPPLSSPLMALSTEQGYSQHWERLNSRNAVVKV